MKKSFSSTLVLTGVFALVLGWYLIWEKKLRPEREKQTNEAKELIQLEPGDIQELIVERQKLPAPGSKEAKGEAVAYETIHLKRTPTSKWTIVAPIADHGDDSVISNLATTLTTTKYDDIVKEKVEDWKPYGLDEPKIKITAIKDPKTKLTLLVGSDTPVGYSSYVRKADSPVLYQTGKALKTAFERQLNDLREHKVLELVRADVEEVEIHGPNGEVLVKRAAPGTDRWNLVRQDTPTDDAEWNKSMNSLLELRATDFAPFTQKDFGRFGLAKPYLTVQITKPDRVTKVQLSFWKTKDKIYVKRADRDTVYEAAKDAIEKLERPASALIDKTLVRFNRFQTKRIRIEHLSPIAGAKKESVELLKVGPDWTIPSEPSAKVNTTKVDALMTSLQDMRIVDYAPTAAKIPAVKIILSEETIKDGKPNEFEAANLSFGALDANFIGGTRTGLAKPFKIKMSDFKTINLGKADFAEAPKEASSDSSKKEPGKEAEQKPKSL